MAWRPALSLFHITINGMNIQGNNPLFSVSGDSGNHITQSNSSQQVPPDRILCAGRTSRLHQASATPVSRRVEAQPRVRRKLDEACAHRGAVYDIDRVAQVASDILSLVEATDQLSSSKSLVDLAMGAYAMAYIALIWCLYRPDEDGRSQIKKPTVQRLYRLLNTVRALLVEEAPRKGFYGRIKGTLRKGRTNKRVLRMREQLVEILRNVENDNNANVLTSLTIALDCPYQ